MIGNATVPDLFRILVLLMGAWTVAVALVVIAVYAMAWWRASHGPKVPWIGLLPAHVSLVTVSYLTLVVSSMFVLVSRIHDPLTWRVPVFGFAYATGLIAMWVILGHSRHRLRSIHDGLKP